MAITNSEILQINATAIVGILIFLTVGTDTIIGFDEDEKRAGSTFIESFVLILIILMIIPFSMSSMNTVKLIQRKLVDPEMPEKQENRSKTSSLNYMFSGFMYVFVGSIAIILLKIMAGVLF